MSKTNFKSKKLVNNYFKDGDDGHRKVKRQKSLDDRKHFRQIDNVLKSRDVNKILNYNDEI